MSDVTDGYRALKLFRKEQSQQNYAASEDTFRVAQLLAVPAGLRLVKHDSTHYALSSVRDGWLINLYPGNQRIYADRNRAKAPFLRMPDREWTLKDIVDAAIADQSQVKE